jgi:hypothetical protein
MVNTGKEGWRVFRVGPKVADLNVGDYVQKVDKADPALAEGWAGAFNSKVRLTVAAAGGGPQQHRVVEVRRTRAERTTPSHTDAERFRKYLAQNESSSGPVDYRHSDLLDSFLRCLEKLIRGNTLCVPYGIR